MVYSSADFHINLWQQSPGKENISKITANNSNGWTYFTADSSWKIPFRPSSMLAVSALQCG